MLGDDGYGSDQYRYIGGVRHCTGFTRTLRPIGGESSGQFEERMDTLGRRLAAMADVETFELTIHRQAGCAAECEVVVRLVSPAPAPIVADERPAARRADARGSRGRGSLKLGIGIA